MSRLTFDETITKLEKIASEDCKCDTIEDEYGGVCEARKAGRTLNKIFADAYDSLEELLQS